MAARRGKSQARRSGGGDNGLPGWAWLVIGVLLTLLLLVLAPKFIGNGEGGGFFRIGPHADADAVPKGSNETDGAFDPGSTAQTAGGRAAGPAKPAQPDKDSDYAFYELLPGEEVAMSDAQIAAIAREEARRTAEAAPPAATDAAAGLPQPLPEAAAGSGVAPKPDATATTAPSRPTTAAAATDAATAKPAAAGTPYILQAGAFQASGDAEAIKARIALLGLNARVESASINGKTMYRVRMGPYATASELAQAKAKLADGELSAVAIKAK